MVNRIILLAYANDLDAFIPEIWAREGILILEERMVAANLVHRDFQNEVANFGDTVNTRKPGEFTAHRKTNSDDVTVQDATATNVAVPLNQHIHVSFVIKDGEQSKSFQDLVTQYMKPAFLAQARMIDRVVLGQVHQFFANGYGTLSGLTSANAVDRILKTRNIMNINKAYEMDRNMLLAPNSETALLSLDAFTSADKVGDEGSALREASLGRKYGFGMYMSQNTPSITNSGSTMWNTDTVNGALLVGATSVVLTTGTDAELLVGNWITFSDEATPHQILTWDGGTKTATFYPALKAAVANGATCYIMQTGKVNLAAGYAAGWAKQIKYDTFVIDPQVGQLISFKTQTGVYYTVVSVDTTNKLIELDRPLDSSTGALADNDVICYGPWGDYNFAFHRNALALVVRPLALPMSGAGARSAVVNNRGLSMRATITYQGMSQGHLVTLDMLAGVKVLDTALGAVMFG